MATHRVTIDLPERSYQSLRTLVDSGEFASESEAVAALIFESYLFDTPNETTLAAMKAGDRGEVETFESLDDFMTNLWAADTPSIVKSG